MVYTIQRHDNQIKQKVLGLVEYDMLDSPIEVLYLGLGMKALNSRGFANGGPTALTAYRLPW
jgi:hypothetical protein